MESLKPRLNPFLFSPDTNFRFILLIVSVLGASLFAYNNLYNQLYRDETSAIWLKCFQDADTAYPLEGLDPDSYINQSFLHTRFLNDCQEPVEQAASRWILLRLGLLILVAGVIYWFMPTIRIRRDRLKVFTSEDDADIGACLLNLCDRAELKRPPVFLLRAINPSPSGLAFGHLGRYYVVLNGGLVVLFYQAPDRFSAIVLHELAHLRNRDVDKTYFSLAIGISFLIVTLVPLAIGNVLSLIENFWGNISFVVWQVFSASIYLPLIYIALTSILRSREAYADARVMMLDDQNGSLRNELKALSTTPDHPTRKLLGLHPNPVWRLKVYDDPDLLFGLSHWDAFLAGIISTFALRELDLFLSTLVPAIFENFSLFGASLFFIPFVASVVGLGVWQKVFAGQVRHRSLSGYGRYGLSLGAGMLIGMALSFSSFLDNSLAFSYSSIWGTIGFNLLLGIVLLLSLFLIFRWVATSASVWLETVTNPGNLRGMAFFGLLTTGVMLSIWVGGFYLLYIFGYEVVIRLALLFAPTLQSMSEFEGLGLSILTESTVASITLLTILFNIPMLLFIVIWVFPLLSRLRKSRTSLQDIFIGQDQAVNLPAETHSQLRPFWAFLTGLLGALGFLALIALLRVLLHFAIDPDTLTSTQWIFNFRILLIGLAIVAQVILAIAVSVTIKALGWAHGLFAAFIAGFLMAIGLAVLPEIGDCIPILSLGKSASCSNFLEGNLALWLGPILVLGWVFSVVPAFIASWLGSFVRSLAVRPSPS